VTGSEEEVHNVAQELGFAWSKKLLFNRGGLCQGLSDEY
jgi:hypothetical protein